MGSKPFSQICFEQVMTTLAKLITYLNIWSLPNTTLYCWNLRETKLMVNNLLIWNFGGRLTPPRMGNGQMMTLGMSMWVPVYDCSFKITATTCFKLIIELFEITWSLFIYHVSLRKMPASKWQRQKNGRIGPSLRLRRKTQFSNSTTLKLLEQNHIDVMDVDTWRNIQHEVLY